MCQSRAHQRMSEDRQTSVNDVREEWVDGVVVAHCSETETGKTQRVAARRKKDWAFESVLKCLSIKQPCFRDPDRRIGT
jgi:uncharacterized protein YcsI (UPF0317 family)